VSLSGVEGCAPASNRAPALSRSPIRTVHLVYPCSDSVAAPYAIGRHLSSRLRTRYEVINYDWTERGRIRPKPGEALVGHPSPERGTIFRRSCSDARWGRVLLLQPYCHGDDQDAYVEPIIRHCDLFLAITGNYWFRDIPNGRFGHWLPKMRHVDLAVDRGEFPALKTAFSPPGMRRFVYIGRDGRWKNMDYLAAIAHQLPAGQVGWIGGSSGHPELSPVGWVDFGTDDGKRALSRFDFLITVGDADGNPTTILEVMAWGLIPVCTPQSGYVGYKGIPNVPLNSVEGACGIIRALQEVPENTLLAMQRENWKLLDEHFNWDRFAAQVVEAVESSASPRCSRISAGNRLRIAVAARRYRPGRPERVAQRLLGKVRRSPQRPLT